MRAAVIFILLSLGPEALPGSPLKPYPHQIPSAKGSADLGYKIGKARGKATASDRKDLGRALQEEAQAQEVSSLKNQFEDMASSLSKDRIERVRCKLAESDPDAEKCETCSTWKLAYSNPDIASLVEQKDCLRAYYVNPLTGSGYIFYGARVDGKIRILSLWTFLPNA